MCEKQSIFETESPCITGHVAGFHYQYSTQAPSMTRVRGRVREHTRGNTGLTSQTEREHSGREKLTATRFSRTSMESVFPELVCGWMDEWKSAG